MWFWCCKPSDIWKTPAQSLAIPEKRERRWIYVAMTWNVQPPQGVLVCFGWTVACYRRPAIESIYLTDSSRSWKTWKQTKQTLLEFKKGFSQCPKLLPWANQCSAHGNEDQAATGLMTCVVHQKALWSKPSLRLQRIHSKNSKITLHCLCCKLMSFEDSLRMFNVSRRWWLVLHTPTFCLEILGFGCFPCFPFWQLRRLTSPGCWALVVPAVTWPVRVARAAAKKRGPRRMSSLLTEVQSCWVWYRLCILLNFIVFLCSVRPTSIGDNWR